jgi:hypothetical protein
MSLGRLPHNFILSRVREEEEKIKNEGATIAIHGGLNNKQHFLTLSFSLTYTIFFNLYHLWVCNGAWAMHDDLA